MDVVFLDTNALLKLFKVEKGSNWLRNFIKDKEIFVSELAFIESATTLARLYRDGTFTKTQAANIFSQIQNSRLLYRVISLGGEPETKKIVSLAFNLPIPLRIRALDAIQLAAAEMSTSLAAPSAFTFVSSDAQLIKAATARGFSVENPENYS